MKTYHKTDPKNVKSILKEGLRREYSKWGRVYLSLFPDMDMGLGHALFEIDLDDKKVNEGKPSQGKPLEEGEWQIISFEDIPTDRIKYLGEYGPNEKPE